MAVAARSTVEDLDVVEDVGAGEFTGFIDALAYALFLQAAAKPAPREAIASAARSAAAARISVTITISRRRQRPPHGCLLQPCDGPVARALSLSALPLLGGR